MLEIHSWHEDGRTCIRNIGEGAPVKFYGDETKIEIYACDERPSRDILPDALPDSLPPVEEGHLSESLQHLQNG